MADQKSIYSEASKHYIEVVVPSSVVDQGRFDRAKLREAEFNEEWKKNPVNIIDIVNAFCPGATAIKRANKFVFKGDRYDVSADMVAGYLRIRDTVLGAWVKIDGTPSKENAETHFKIKKREEM